jgi:hypothetical protein
MSLPGQIPGGSILAKLFAGLRGRKHGRKLSGLSDASASIRRQVWEARETSVSLPDPGRCDRGDPIGPQAVFLVGLKDRLAEDCGPLPEGHDD